MLVEQRKPPSADDALDNETAAPTPKVEPEAKPKAEPNGEAKAPRKRRASTPKAEPKAKVAKATTKKAPKTPKVAKTPKTKPSMADMEAGLIKKYSKQDIVKGSLKEVGSDADFPNKRTVQIICQTKDCGTKRRIATSDLHQTKHCLECTKGVRTKRRTKDKPTKAKVSKKRTKPAREAVAAEA